MVEAMEKRRKTTVTDIASRLDISASTVSRVLNGSRLASEPTRKLIIETAEELGYRKRNTRRHGKRAILIVALFLPHTKVPYRHLFYDPAELIAGLEAGFADVRVHVVTSLNDADPEILRHKKLGDLDAAVFGFTTPKPKVAQYLEEQAIPTVLLNRVSRRLNYVSCDNGAGIRALLKRIAACRKEVRPCYINYSPAQPVSTYREAAFFEACNAFEIPATEEDVLRVSTLEEIGGDVIDWIRKRGYNAVLCFNDFVAVYFYQVALAHRIRVPEELAIAGFDNSPVRELTPQKIDTIALSPFDLGKEAGAWLRDSVIERSPTQLQKMIVGKYIPGETVCGKPTTVVNGK